jgi:ubiquinone/menaquinone biosynthesis C-methylase UbiE
VRLPSFAANRALCDPPRQLERWAVSEAIYAGAAVGYDELFARATSLFIPSLFRAAHLTRGQNVLDVATGTGVVAQAAAEIVGRSGSVTAGDISPSMLEAARRKLTGLPIVLEMFDGHNIPHPDKHFHAVICQLGLMFFTDPARALAEFFRVLRDGGWTAVSVSSGPERSLFARVGAVIARHVPERAAKLNRFFSIRDPERLRSLLRAASFHAVQVESESRTIEFASFDAYFSGIEEGATLSGQEYVQLAPDVRHVVREEVRRQLESPPDKGPLAVEMEVHIGSGRR